MSELANNIVLSKRRSQQPNWLLGIVLSIVATILVGFTFVLGLHNNFSLGYLIFVTSEPLGALVGGLIVARQPRNIVGWLILCHVFCFIGAEFFRQYALFGAITAPGALPFAVAFAWPAYWLWGPGITCGFVLLPFFFPDGKLISPRWRVVLWLIIGAMSIATFNMAFQPGDGETPGLANPLGFLPVIQPDSPLNVLFSLLWVGSALLGIIALFVRFYYADSEQRQQIQWLLYAVAILLIGDRLVSNSGLIAELFLLLSISGIWAAIGIAMLRHRLYDINILINRTLVYGVLTALISVFYIGSVAYLSTLTQLSNLLGEVWLSPQLVTTIIVAVSFQPLRDWLQRLVNRLLYGHRDEPYLVLTRLSQRLGLTLSPTDILPTVVETVRETLKLPFAAVVLHEQDHEIIAASSGQSTGDQLAIPLIYQHEPIGALILGQRPGKKQFSRHERQLLVALADHISVAAHAVRLTRDLQNSRERTVTAREEERRRLQRDLHDDLGPTLASMTMQIDTARALMADDPETSESLLTDVKQQLQVAIGSVRRIVYHLRPPTLDQFGLTTALREHVRQRSQRTEVHILFDAPDSLPQLPAAVEVAAYYIVVEALNNALRHAQAAHCHIQLSVNHQQLVISIIDDGIGLSWAHRVGVGLHSIRERAEELGGSCSIQTHVNGGTSVRASLPLEGFKHGNNSRAHS